VAHSPVYGAQNGGAGSNGHMANPPVLGIAQELRGNDAVSRAFIPPCNLTGGRQLSDQPLVLTSRNPSRLFQIVCRCSSFLAHQDAKQERCQCTEIARHRRRERIAKSVAALFWGCARSGACFSSALRRSWIATPIGHEGLELELADSPAQIVG